MTSLTRADAISELIDEAIGAWLNGKHACAITLAGAAETGMPRAQGNTSAFDTLKTVVAAFEGCSEKRAVELLTIERNWIKHFTEDKPPHIDTSHAWLYVARAYVQFRASYPSSHLTKNMLTMQVMIDDKLQPVRDAIQWVQLLMQRLAEILRR